MPRHRPGKPWKARRGYRGAAPRTRRITVSSSPTTAEAFAPAGRAAIDATPPASDRVLRSREDRMMQKRKILYLSPQGSAWDQLAVLASAWNVRTATPDSLPCLEEYQDRKSTRLNSSHVK